MSDYFERVERQIVHRVEGGAPRPFRLRVAGGELAVAAAVLVVIVVAGVFLLARGGAGRNPAPTSEPAVRVALIAAPGASPGALARSAQILRERLSAAGVGAGVATAGGELIVTAPQAGARSQILALAAPGRLVLYDWEGNVLAPNGKTVASQLPSPDPSVLDISQGNGSSAPGELGSGCMPLQQALALADRLGAGRPRRIEYIGRTMKLRVPVGYTVIEVAGSQPARPSDGFFVLRDVPALSESMLVNPRQSTDPNIRAPDVEFAFTASGRRAFQRVTAAIAHRGQAVSSLGNTLNQHFAIVLDNRLISVPYVDYKQYPDGINGDSGADVVAGFTTQSAKNVAILLRYGALPVTLTATG